MIDNRHHAESVGGCFQRCDIPLLEGLNAQFSVRGFKQAIEQLIGAAQIKVPARGVVCR